MPLNVDARNPAPEVLSKFAEFVQEAVCVDGDSDGDVAVDGMHLRTLGALRMKGPVCRAQELGLEETVLRRLQRLDQVLLLRDSDFVAVDPLWVRNAVAGTLWTSSSAVSVEQARTLECCGFGIASRDGAKSMHVPLLMRQVFHVDMDTLLALVDSSSPDDAMMVTYVMPRSHEDWWTSVVWTLAQAGISFSLTSTECCACVISDADGCKAAIVRMAGNEMRVLFRGPKALALALRANIHKVLMRVRQEWLGVKDDAKFYKVEVVCIKCRETYVVVPRRNCSSGGCSTSRSTVRCECEGGIPVCGM